MRTLFKVLERIQQRPGLYVGGAPDCRREQLLNLQWLITGYELACQEGEFDVPAQHFTAAFGEYLAKRFGWSMSRGPVAAILDETTTGDEAWTTFWRLVQEFRSTIPV